MTANPAEGLTQLSDHNPNNSHLSFEPMHLIAILIITISV